MSEQEEGKGILRGENQPCQDPNSVPLADHRHEAFCQRVVS